MTGQAGERARPGECGVFYDQHPTMSNLVAVCTRPGGHDDDHDNTLPKTLASSLNRTTPPGPVQP